MLVRYVVETVAYEHTLLLLQGKEGPLLLYSTTDCCSNNILQFF